MSDTDSEPITKATSERICKHMNEDHAASVFGMVRNLCPPQAEVKDVSMVAISLQQCDFSCSIDGKTMLVAVPFEPPLSSVADARPRLVEIHQQVLSPKVSMLWTVPPSLLILIVCSGLAFATYAVGTDNMAEIIENAHNLNSTISSIFGSADRFAKFVVGSWHFAIIAHALEASYVAYHASQTLKLKPPVVLKWFGLVCCVGMPITRRFLEFLRAHSQQPSKMQKKKK